MIRLTQYSHGAGCGCKISPQILNTILQTTELLQPHPNLLVGNHSRDDAAAYDLGDGTAIISTTDFFMPIVDDPFTFGKIAAANAISDVYAMGGKPLMAIAVLGWPINVLSPEVAQQVLEGGRATCAEAGIVIAGGHSIDCPEPIFGLAVTGRVPIKHLKQNSKGKVGAKLFLTKPLGVGILATAQKKGFLRDEDAQIAPRSMTQLNKVGEFFGQCEYIQAMTDVTGFGLLGHLTEMCEGSNVSARIFFDRIPTFETIDYYIKQKAIPGGTHRNWASYGHKINPLTDYQKAILCDPQTSGGLLVAVSPASEQAFQAACTQLGLSLKCIGQLTEETYPLIQVI